MIRENLKKLSVVGQKKLKTLWIISFVKVEQKASLTFFRKVKLNCPLAWLQKLRCNGALCPWDHEIF